MALIGNYSVIAKQVSSKIGGQSQNDLSNWCNTGQMRNWGSKSDGTNWGRSAMPEGTSVGSSWLLPIVAGNMSSYSNAKVTIGAVAAGVMGAPIAGIASISLFCNEPEGSLVVFGSGSASISITCNNPSLTSPLYGSGAAGIVLSATGSLGALAGISGTATITLGGTATILPLNGGITLPSGLASIVLSGSAIPSAIGYMEGSTTDNTVLSAQGISREVWAALGVENNIPGSMGNKLNTASSGGVDLEALSNAVWSQIIDGGYSAEDLMKLMSAVLAGKADIVGDTVIFRDVGDNKDRVTSTSTALGGRTTVDYDVS